MRRKLGLRTSISIAAACAALLPQTAFGQTTAASPAASQLRRDARALTDSAESDYEAGRFDAATVGYQQAYVLVPEPQLLFNIGQCQRKLGRPQRAKHFFEAYLRARPDAPERPVVEQLIAEAKQQLQAREAQQREAISARRAASAASSTAVGAQRAPADEDDDPLLFERWWFWTGLVAIAGGAVAATLIATREPEEDTPEASLGTIRWR